MKTDLEKYEAVNKCSTLKELADVIRSFAIKGMIQGRTREFEAEKMAYHCETFNLFKHTRLTRELGIRQHAMMILYYNGN